MNSVVNASIEQQNISQTRKKKKKKSTHAEPRQNIVEKHLDPAVRIKVSESVRSKSKLTDKSLNNSFHIENQNSDVINVGGGSGSGEISNLEKITALN